MKRIKKEDLKIKEKLKNGFKRFWFLLWQDNSFKGWLFSLIFLFIFVQFVFFPVLKGITGTSLPLAIVETCSMYHQGNFFSSFEGWFDRQETKYLRFNISREEFETFPLRRGFSKGDILFIIKPDINKLKVGDIIAFQSEKKSTPIVHRIIRIKEEEGKRIFTTLGDNNKEILNSQNNLWGINEESVEEDQIIGKIVFRVVPSVGWLKLIFFEPTKPYMERGFCKES